MRKLLMLVGVLALMVVLQACGSSSGGGGGSNGDNEKPVINSFTANPTNINAGQSSTLSWSVSGATSLSINSGVGDVTSQTSVTVHPSTTTNYTLTATNSFGSAKAGATVTVTNATTSYTLSLNGSNGEVKVNGTTENLPYSGSFAAGSRVTLQAIPDSGYSFSGWSGDLSGSTNPTSESPTKIG